MPCHLVAREGTVHAALQSSWREKRRGAAVLGKPSVPEAVDHRLENTRLQLEGAGRPRSSFKNLIFLSSRKSFLKLDPVNSIKGTQRQVPLPGNVSSRF